MVKLTANFKSISTRTLLGGGKGENGGASPCLERFIALQQELPFSLSWRLPSKLKVNLMKKSVSVSIPRWLYERIRDYFHANKEELALWGVKSVNGLISTWLEHAMGAVTGRYEGVREAVKNIPERRSEKAVPNDL